MKNYLNFENDIKDLEIELDKLKDPYNQGGLSEVDTNKISKTQEELDKKLKEACKVERSHQWVVNNSYTISLLESQKRCSLNADLERSFSEEQ